MDTQPKTKKAIHIKNSLYLVFLLGVMLIPILGKDLTLDFKLFVHDFNEETIFRRFFYHLGLMIQPTVLCWIIFIHAKGFWKIIALSSFLWFLKDCIDVVINNNQATNYEFDLFAYIMIIVITLLWIRLKDRMAN